MKKVFILICTLLIFNVANSQEQKKGLWFKSISFSIFPLELSTTKNEQFLSATLDASFSYKKNIFSLVLNKSSNIFSPTYNQVNLMYGREIEMGNNFSFEFHGGFGYFSKDSGNVIYSTSGLGIPLMLKLKYTFRKSFSMGLRVTENINSIENLTTFGILFQWDFK